MRGLSKRECIDVGLTGAVFIVAAAVALGHIDSVALSEDEYATIAIAGQSGAALWHGIAGDGGNMSGYYLLIHLLERGFGDAPALMRMPSVLAFGALAAAVGDLARRLSGDRRVGAVAGLLTALSPALVPYADLARGYAPMLLFETLSFTALLAVLTAAPGRPLTLASAAYCASLVAALYCGFEVVVVIAAQVAWVCWRRERIRAVLVSLGLTAALCIPIVVMALNRGSGQLYWVPDGHFALLGQAWSVLSLGVLGRTPGVILIGECISGVVVALMLWGVRRPRAVDPPAPGSRIELGPLVASWIVLPGLLIAGASLAGEPIELNRYALMLCPALAIGLAALVLDRRLPPAVSLLAVLVAVALRVVGLHDVFAHQPALRAPPAVAQIIDDSRSRPSCIVFYQQDQRQHFEYWIARTRGDLAVAERWLTPILPAAGWNTVRSYVEADAVLDTSQLQEVFDRCRRVFYWYGYGGDLAVPAVRARVQRGHRLLVSLARGYRRVMPITRAGKVVLMSEPIAGR